MIKVLITGAAGTIGLEAIKYLLSEGKYEITALDLRSKRTYKRLKKYKRRINIVYGDVNDQAIVDALVKDHNIVFHFAGIMPPFADIRSSLCYDIDYLGTKNILNAIDSYNKKCHLFYPSTTTIYGKRSNYDYISINDEIKIDPIDTYIKTKFDTETLIKDCIKNYTILRLPQILTNPKINPIIYNTPKNSYVEFITDSDAAYAFVKGASLLKELNKKTLIVSGGEKCRMKYRNFIIKMLEIHGLSLRYILTLLLVDKNYYGGYYKLNPKYTEELNYQSKSIDTYFKEIKSHSHGRLIRRLLAKPFIAVLKINNK